MICVHSVNVYPQRIAMKTGEWYYNARAEVCPSNASCPCVTWSSSDPSIAIVHPTNGYIHGGRPGTATVYATATDGSGRQGCCTVTVSQRIYVNSITLNTFQISIQRNNNYLLTAEVCPSNADNKAINWCSSNTEVATVRGGRVYAHKKGAAVITAAAADGSGTEAKCYVNVTENYLVTLITVEPACKTLAVGSSVLLQETVYPNHATNKEVCWSSSNEYVAFVNPSSGFVAARHAGTATIYATAADGSGKRGCCQITVIPPVNVTGITLCPQEQSIRIGETRQLEAVLSPANATNRSISWCSSNSDVVSVGYYSGIIRALSEGTAVITATSASGGFQASCQIWVKGKTPVFLIHGRTSNSFDTWGATNEIFVNPLNPSEKSNNHFDSNLEALSTGSAQALYINRNVQELRSYPLGLPITVDGVVDNNFTVPAVHNGEFKDGNFTTQHPEGGNLAYYLKNSGYKENVNLFVFNYPNEDAVVHSALKFKKYIENLIEFVRTNGSEEMKYCFYDSEADYKANHYKINLVGHSMGGLVSRYYIENLGCDEHVDKLITIDTPHWGSGYANVSNATGIQHKLCDHDLDFNSAMYGGSNSAQLSEGCELLINKCINQSYILTTELDYLKSRNTKYYAIAGVDYNATLLNGNDYTFEMPINYTTYQQIIDYFTGKQVYEFSELNGITYIDIQNAGDNMVGLLSQIGWTEGSGDTPAKKIAMEKIFIDIDTNGGNGNGIPGVEAINMFHGKIQHRPAVMQQVYNYLSE